MNYFGGKPMPENVKRALLLTGAIGFMSRPLWNEFFAVGAERWGRRQLRFMIDRGLLAGHSNPAARDCWVLTPLAKQYLENENTAIVRPAPVAQIHHDECIARWLFRLSKDGIIGKWQGELELKQSQVRAFQLSRDVRKPAAYPAACA